VIPGTAAASLAPAAEEVSEADIKFGYCTEFIIMLEKEYTEDTELKFKAFLESIGDSIVVVSDDGIVKVHVHTNQPGEAITRALTYGSLTSMKIDNMREEHHERLIKDAEKAAANQKEEAAKEEVAKKEMEPPKEVGFISVSIGDGIADIFKDLGVDYLIEGGQTMNPSTEDMLTAIEKVNAKNIFILPNNKNIILAANQAKSMTEDKNIFVIPTKTIPQGITAIINYVAEKTAEENAAVMEEEIGRVKTGQLTYAVRDTHIDDKTIQAGDIMGVGDHAILAVGKEIDPVAEETIALMMDDDAELISIYYGEDMREEEAEALKARIEELYPDCDIELNYGGQPIYYYIISVE
jgi:DAK2 domain fusion protein YloV